MRFFVLAFMASALIIFDQSVSAASELSSLPKDVTYTRDLKVRYESFPAIVDKAFEHIAFSTLKGNGKSLSINSLDLMDRVYIPKYGEAFKDPRIVFAKSGVELKGSAQLNEIYHAGDGYLVHFKDSSSGIVAVFFKGFQLNRVEKVRDEIVTLLKGNTKSTAQFQPSSNKVKLFEIFSFNNAFAENSTACSGYFGSMPGASLSTSSFEKLWSCTKGFAGGMWDSTGGSVVSIAKGAYNVVIHPVDTFNKASEEFEKIKAVMSDLEGAFGDLKAAFQQLPEEVKVKIGCEVVGSVGMSGLIAYFTAGAGSPALMKSIAQAMEKVASLIPKNQAASAKVLSLAKGMTNKANRLTERIDSLAKLNKNLAQWNKEIEVLEKRYAKGPPALSEDAAENKSLVIALTYKPLAREMRQSVRNEAREFKNSDPALYKSLIEYADDMDELAALKNSVQIHKDWKVELQKSVEATAAQKGAVIAVATGGACTTAASAASQWGYDPRISPSKSQSTGGTR